MPERKVIVCGMVFRWEEKAPFVDSGASVQGALEYDSDADALKCHECGDWFVNLSNHVARSHGIAPRMYKIQHGLAQSSALVGIQLRQRMKDEAKRADREQYLKPGRDQCTRGLEAGRKSGEASSAAACEKRNLRQRCKAQLSQRLAAIAADLGRRPKYRELLGMGIDLRSAAASLGVSPKQLLRSSGQEPRLNKLPDGVQQYQDEVLIEALRDFYILNKRLPSGDDWGIGILPSRRTYCEHFRSLDVAYGRAGLLALAIKRRRDHARQAAGMPRKPRGAVLAEAV